jgi:hypothetical protein
MAAVFQQKDNLWREFLNPMRGLTMERIVQLVEQRERGVHRSEHSIKWHLPFPFPREQG